MAHHIGVHEVPGVIAYGPPLAVDVQLHTALVNVGSIHQPNTWMNSATQPDVRLLDEPTPAPTHAHGTTHTHSVCPPHTLYICTYQQACRPPTHRSEEEGCMRGADWRVTNPHATCYD
eukprot:1651479-Pyramimonas_sp.AAC.2